jgi:hypothetical protein
MTKKLLIGPIVAIVFLVSVWIVCYVGFFKQKAALDDIFNNRFQNYQASASIVKELVDVHGNIYKVLSLMGTRSPKNTLGNCRKTIQKNKDVLAGFRRP